MRAWLLVLAGCGRIGFDPIVPADAGTTRIFAYVVNRSQAVTILELDPRDGSLTETPASPFDPGVQAEFAVANATGTALYLASRASASVHTLRIDRTTGGLTEIDDDPVPIPTMAALHSSGRWLYAADNTVVSGRVYGFAVQPDDTLVAMPGSPFSDGGGDTQSVTIHPNGRWLYALGNLDKLLRGFDITADGSLAARSFAWPTTDDAPWVTVIEPTGRFGFIAPDRNGGIPGFTLDATGTPSTTPGGPFGSNGNTSLDACLSNDGQLLVANDGNSTISAFAIDSAGGLVHVPGSPRTVQLAWAIAAAPVGNLVIATSNNGALGVYHIDGTGLQPIDEAIQFPSFNFPQHIAFATTH